MTITLEIPDSAGAVLAAFGQNPSRCLLEAFALEGYRTNRLTHYQVQRLLGLEYFEQVDGFLKQNGVSYPMEYVEEELAAARRYLSSKAELTDHKAE